MKSLEPRQIQLFLSGKREDGETKPPYLLRQRSSTVFILATVCLAIFTDILFYGLIVPVIPFSLTIQVGVPEDQVQQWTATLLACYNVALFLGSPVVGIYADHSSSRRLPLLIGLLALAASTLLLCLGRTIALLIVGRILQGFSAAIVWSVGLALLADTMGRKIGYSMGWVSIAMSAGLLISPVIGGAVYATEGYYAVYYVAFGVIFCDIVLRLLLIEKKVARQWIKVDDPAVTEDKTVPVPPSAPVDGTGPEITGVQEPMIPAETSIPVDAPAESPGLQTSTAVKHPHLHLIKSRRMIAALAGSAIEAGVM
jgi:MFS family permease